MIKHVGHPTLSQLFSDSAPIIFEIPIYQRPYAWTYTHWQALFDDIVQGDAGHFLGTLLCITRTSKHAQAIPVLDLVDGQQRVTTLQLFYAALYQLLKERKEQLSERDRSQLFKLEDRLVARRDDTTALRLVPQIHEDNKQNFQAIASELDLHEPTARGINFGNRRLPKAYKFFVDQITSLFEESEGEVNKIKEIWSLLDQAVIVKIEVEDQEAAYKLFESLNNRGEPLTAIDIIKNKLLSVASQKTANVDEVFLQWDGILKRIGSEYKIHERFLRHHYHAFRSQYLTKGMPPRATRSKLIKIYEELIDRDFENLLLSLERSSETYAELLLMEGSSVSHNLESSLFNLEKAQGAPGYMLLLFVFRERTDHGLSEQQLVQIVNMLVSFFVRRNLTNTPPTYKLDQIFIDLVDRSNEYRSDQLIQVIRTTLHEHTASDEAFASALRGPLYNQNVGATRFILSQIARRWKTREMKDPWVSSAKGVAVYSVEHIFPKGRNIPEAWVNEIAGGDVARAEELQEELVHTLGNLTLTAYNSQLSNRAFLIKRDFKDKAGNFTGFKNGLGINRQLADTIKWSAQQIRDRTEQLADEAENLFAL